MSKFAKMTDEQVIHACMTDKEAYRYIMQCSSPSRIKLFSPEWSLRLSVFRAVLTDWVKQARKAKNAAKAKAKKDAITQPKYFKDEPVAKIIAMCKKDARKLLTVRQMTSPSRIDLLSDKHRVKLLKVREYFTPAAKRARLLKKLQAA